MNAIAFLMPSSDFASCSFTVSLSQSDELVGRLLKMAWPADLDADLKADANTKNKIMVRFLLAGFHSCAMPRLHIDIVVFSFFNSSSTLLSPSEADIMSMQSPSEALDLDK